MDLIKNPILIPVIFICIILILRVIEAGWFSMKIDSIAEIKNSDIKMYGISFFMIFIFGVVGMVLMLWMCQIIPSKEKV